MQYAGPCAGGTRNSCNGSAPRRGRNCGNAWWRCDFRLVAPPCTTRRVEGGHTLDAFSPYNRLTDHSASHRTLVPGEWLGSHRHDWRPYMRHGCGRCRESVNLLLTWIRRSSSGACGVQCSRHWCIAREAAKNHLISFAYPYCVLCWSGFFWCTCTCSSVPSTCAWRPRARSSPTNL